MPVDNKTPISITLLAEEWNAVLDVLSDGKFRIVGPLIQKIVEQAQPKQVEPEQPSLHTRLQPVS
jgi:hypothetical protein